MFDVPGFLGHFLFFNISAMCKAQFIPTIICFLLLCCTVNGAAQQTPIPEPEPASTPIIITQTSPLSISGNTELCPGTETILKAEGNFVSFIWDKGNVKGRYLKVKEPGVYEVTAKTKGGCTFTTKVTVRFRPCPV